MMKFLLPVIAGAILIFGSQSAAFAKNSTLGEDVVAFNRDLQEFTSALTLQNQQAFFFLYTNYNMIQTVKTIRFELGKAVDACSDANPEMEKTMRDRYRIWTDSVDEVMTEAQGHINTMLFEQEYADEETVKGLLARADDLRIRQNEAENKVPVTSAEACEFMTEKMDETQQNMISLLRSTLLNLPDGNLMKQFEAETETP